MQKYPQLKLEDGMLSDLKSHLPLLELILQLEDLVRAQIRATRTNMVVANAEIGDILVAFREYIDGECSHPSIEVISLVDFIDHNTPGRTDAAVQESLEAENDNGEIIPCPYTPNLFTLGHSIRHYGWTVQNPGEDRPSGNPDSQPCVPTGFPIEVEDLQYFLKNAQQLRWWYNTLINQEQEE